MRKTILTAIAVVSLFSVVPANASVPPTVLGQVGSSRPSDCPRLWCGCWLKKMLKHMGYSTKGASNLARAYAGYGVKAAPGSEGSIMVMRGHVGLVVGQCGPGKVKLVSGNHNHRVGIGCYPMRRAIAWRKPTNSDYAEIRFVTHNSPKRVKVTPTSYKPHKIRRNFNL
jgi:hypothetical protein